MRFLLLFSRQGKLRLQKWFTPIPEREKKKITRDMTTMVLARKPRSCNFLHWKDLKIVYKRYASLYFCCGLDAEENELLALEMLHRYVELLDKYFGNVCELDIIFNFEKAYFILDEFLLGGEVQETSKLVVARSVEASDMLQEKQRLMEIILLFPLFFSCYHGGIHEQACILTLGEMDLHTRRNLNDYRPGSLTTVQNHGVMSSRMMCLNLCPEAGRKCF
ncbi:AP-1 complex subunit sigma-2-like isoform X1 [Oncorhynchus nerka]|uniref:AP-1 complex subunit sigma-2-like isoform X1 n=1 Tax=Oncorhynchus nerka TaxID=8023 RepID=UPI0031B7F198